MGRKRKLENDSEDFYAEENSVQIYNMIDLEAGEVLENEIPPEIDEENIDMLFEPDIVNIEDAVVLSEETDDMIILPEIKTEMCKIIKIRDNGIMINFKGNGLWIKTKGLIDKDLIPKDYIEVQYTSEIGLKDFTKNLIFK